MVLVEKTKEVSRGIFKGDLNIASPPEVSELSSAFNAMCDKLKGVEKFNQLPVKTSEWMKGTGLGLAIVKHIITAHGGKVWAESKPGQGSAFIFVLPS
jgi:nitrogen fixation/metabolism regulation signal transduction histidine kinase